jgi:hypothetical protein
MSCLKDDWVIFNNNLLRVHLSYRVEGTIKVTIGNKNSMDLQKFTLLEDGKPITEGEILSAKSYFTHQASNKKHENKKPFITLQIRYSLGYNSLKTLV